MNGGARLRWRMAGTGHVAQDRLETRGLQGGGGVS